MSRGIYRRWITVAVTYALLLSCRMVSEGRGSGLPPITTGSPFDVADSLILRGENRAAVQRLLALLESSPRYRDAVLWRLFGVFHGCGMEVRGAQLLDSLETEGYGPLTGWRISLLDMGRETDRALQLIDDDVLLGLWLQRDLPDSTVLGDGLVLPRPADMADRFVRVMYAKMGGLTREQIGLAVEDAEFLPGLRGRLAEELAVRCALAGSWWEELASRLFPADSPESRRLAVLRMERTGEIDPSLLREALDDGGEVGAEAARLLLRYDPYSYRRSWRVVDALAESEDLATADSLMESSTDTVFSVGARMALLRAREEYDSLVVLCRSVDSESPESLLSRSALYQARALRALRRRPDAYLAYLNFARRFPHNPTAGEAAYLAGKYFDGEQDWPMAARAYLTSLGCAGTWEGDSRAYWRGGFSLYMSGSGRRADSLWREGVERYSYDYWRDEMLFWRARYAFRDGAEDAGERLLRQLAREHPWEFYGMLAARRLGAETFRPGPVPTTDVCADRLSRLAVKMTAEGYGSLASEMLLNGTLGEASQRARMLSLMGEHRPALTLLRRMDSGLRESGRGMLPDTLLPFYFPLPYRDLIASVSSGLRLGIADIAGIVREESYFNRFVVSWAGATGLIQLMPGTAYDIARWNDLPQLSEDDFYMPYNSLLYGSLYIERQLGAFGGQAPLFLAAYNAGPGNASRWKNGHGWDPADPELFVEQITYRETRMYVKKVLRSVWIYGGYL
ncbi:transglycosylase SLT domain-containing protein [Candidatus Fermentibacteria bacterium]|nr:transglycosylase SLT domain-containing protein [Candidatus Fermentibacteria bacterium]